MDNLNAIENVAKIFEKCSYTWILHKFSKLCKEYKFGSFLYSPTFPEGKNIWKLAMYPNSGGSYKEDEVPVSVFLYNIEKSHPFTKYSLYYQTSRDEIISEMHKEHIFKETSRGWSFPIILTREKLKSSIDDDIVKISVVVSTHVFTLQPTHVISPQKKDNLKTEFERLLEKGEFSDFVIKLDDSSEIKVHKNILVARSPVFSAMLKNNTLENKVGYVKIIDIEKDIMMLFLNFIYTGSVNSDLSVENAQKLLPAADKYGLLDLKQLCAKNLADNLKVTNVEGILLLAEFYNISSLKNKALEYILENTENFSDPVMFEKLKIKAPDLLVELIIKTFKTFHPETKVSY